MASHRRSSPGAELPTGPLAIEGTLYRYDAGPAGFALSDGGLGSVSLSAPGLDMNIAGSSAALELGNGQWAIAYLYQPAGGPIEVAVAPFVEGGPALPFVVHEGFSDGGIAPVLSASNGTLDVLWQEGSSSAQPMMHTLQIPFAALLSPDGGVSTGVAPPPFDAGTRTLTWGVFAASSDGGRPSAAWLEGGALTAASLDLVDGTAQESGPYAVSPYAPGALVDDGQPVVALVGPIGSLRPQVEVAALAPNGSVTLSSTGIPIVRGTKVALARTNGDGLLMLRSAFDGGTGDIVAVASVTGAELGAPQPVSVTTTSSTELLAAHVPGSTAVLWSETTLGGLGGSIENARVVFDDGGFGPVIYLGGTTPGTRWYVAGAGNVFRLMESPQGSQNLYGVPLSATLESIDAGNMQLPAPPGAYDFEVSSSSTHARVVFTTNNSVWGLQLDETGAGVPVQLLSLTAPIAVARTCSNDDGSRELLVELGNGNGTDFPTFIYRVEDGGVVDAGPAFIDGGISGCGWAGDRWVIVQRRVDGVHVRELSVDGVLAQNEALLPFDDTTPVVAHQGNNAVIVAATGATPKEVQVFRLGEQGVLRDSLDLGPSVDGDPTAWAHGHLQRRCLQRVLCEARHAARPRDLGGCGPADGFHVGRLHDGLRVLHRRFVLARHVLPGRVQRRVPDLRSRRGRVRDERRRHRVSSEHRTL